MLDRDQAHSEDDQQAGVDDGADQPGWGILGQPDQDVQALVVFGLGGRIDGWCQIWSGWPQRRRRAKLRRLPTAGNRRRGGIAAGRALARESGQPGLDEPAAARDLD